MVGDVVAAAPIAAEPPRGYELVKFSVARLRWESVMSPNTDGLYRARAYGRDRFWLRRGGQSREIDRDYGIWAALRDEKRHVVAYREVDLTGTLFVPQTTPLPLYRRELPFYAAVSRRSEMARPGHLRTRTYQDD